ncbi:uncharacterized protein LOC124651942 [Lolium rigidum]|uniref:uncharacterized protein LOC124651942 n=1 Tax=Lolium rigidum TaxID=89674 RepID=UPI001F5C5915|nr:uncharacterized protein LOC124651942 [Lolium rigidum]
MSNLFDHGHGGGDQGQGADGTLMCYFHPRELLVGVCAHCLRERLLLILASKQGGGRASAPADGASYLSARPYGKALRRVRTSSIVSVLALGSSLLHRIESSSSRHHTHDAVVHGSDDNNWEDDDGEDTASVASLDDSFISIKFEDNGKATWVDTQNQKPTMPHAADKSAYKATTAVVEHAKRGGAARWRKQVVGRLLQLARWKRASASGKQAASSTAVCQAAEHQRAKGRGGRSWIRSLTRRRALHGERAWS